VLQAIGGSMLMANSPAILTDAPGLAAVAAVASCSAAPTSAPRRYRSRVRGDGRPAGH
jgi:hypothetical protein